MCLLRERKKAKSAIDFAVLVLRYVGSTNLKHVKNTNHHRDVNTEKLNMHVRNAVQVCANTENLNQGVRNAEQVYVSMEISSNVVKNVEQVFVTTEKINIGVQIVAQPIVSMKNLSTIVVNVV